MKRKQRLLSSRFLLQLVRSFLKRSMETIAIMWARMRKKELSVKLEGKEMKDILTREEGIYLLVSASNYGDYSFLESIKVNK